MSLESSLRLAGSSISSDRASDRKKYLDELKSFLDGNAAPKLLTENQKKGSGYDWDSLFEDVLGLIRKECEKFDKVKTFENAKRQCVTLLYNTVAGCNKGKAFINSTRIIQSFLDIIQNTRLVKAFGNVFINLFLKSVMTYEGYLENFKPENWEELLDSCVSLHNEDSSIVDHSANLKLIALLIKNASKYCHFVIPLRDNIQKLKKYIYLGADLDPKTKDVAMNIAVLTLTMLSSECRETMCEFSEYLLPKVLRCFYDSNQKQKVVIFQYLDLIMRLHHPHGVSEHQSGSMAHDWAEWNKHLSALTQIFNRQALECEKSTVELNEMPEYLTFAARTLQQKFIGSHSSSRPTEEGEREAKRPRLSTTNLEINTFDGLVQQAQCCHMPWLCITAAYLQLFGDKCSAADIIKSLRLVHALVSSNRPTKTGIMWKEIRAIFAECIKYITADKVIDAELASIVPSLWNAFISHSTSTGQIHITANYVIGSLLKLDLIEYNNIRRLLKMYHEKTIPITNESLTTLKVIIEFYHVDLKEEQLHIDTIETILRLPSTVFASVKQQLIEEIILRILAKDKVTADLKCHSSDKALCQVLFDQPETNILISSFDIPLHKFVAINSNVSDSEKETNIEVHTALKEHTELIVLEKLKALQGNKLLSSWLEKLKLIHITFLYFKNMLTHKVMVDEELGQNELWKDLRKTHSHIYREFVFHFTDELDLNARVKILDVFFDILNTDYNDKLDIVIREPACEEFFRAINTKVFNSNDKMSVDSDDCENEDPRNLMQWQTALKVLAAYCKREAPFRDRLLAFVLDSELYDFGSAYEVNAAFECIKILNSSLDNKPIDDMFSLLRSICQNTFRKPDISSEVIDMIELLAESIAIDGSSHTKTNCSIMINGYKHKCETGHYAPECLGKLHGCMAKLHRLSKRHNLNVAYTESILSGLNHNVHALRIACTSYVDIVLQDSKANALDELKNLLNSVFRVKLSGESEESNNLILRDETANRTSTALHCLYAFANSRPSYTNIFVAFAINLLKRKSLDLKLMKKVLTMLVNETTGKSLEVFLSRNFLLVMKSWFDNKYELKDIPFELFGCDSFEAFVEKYFELLIPIEVMWGQAKDFSTTEGMKVIKTKFENNVSSILQLCFCNIMSICLPYVVYRKYKMGGDDWAPSVRLVETASGMYEATIQTIGSSEVGTIFSENIGRLVLLITQGIFDSQNMEEKLGYACMTVNTPNCYPLRVYKAVLKYFAEMIDENVVKHLCDNFSYTIANILLKLWIDVKDETIAELKVIKLYRFVVFYEEIPLDTKVTPYSSNYVCEALQLCLKNDWNRIDLKPFCNAMLVVLRRILPERADVIKDLIPKIIAILTHIKKRGNIEADKLLNFLLKDMSYCIQSGIDLVDGGFALTQRSIDDQMGLTTLGDTLKCYIAKLVCYSVETLKNLSTLIKHNKRVFKELIESLSDLKGFSEDCDESVVHQLIKSLTDIIQNSDDENCVLEACDCIGQMGVCNLQTLVTVGPKDVGQIRELAPAQYLAVVAAQALVDGVFDEDPHVGDKASKALRRLFSFREGILAKDYTQINKNKLVPFLSKSKHTSNLDHEIASDKLDLLVRETVWLPLEGETHEAWLIRLVTDAISIFNDTNDYIPALAAVCELKYSVARQLFAPIMGLIMKIATEQQIVDIAAKFDKIIQHFASNIDIDREGHSAETGREHTKPNSITKHKVSIQCLLEVVDFVRLQKRHYKKRPASVQLLENHNFMQLDYRNVSKAACFIGNEFSAIYYGELFCIAQNDFVPPSGPEHTSKLPGGDEVLSVLRKSYIAIGNDYAISGCGTAHLSEDAVKRAHLIRTGHYSDALLLHDVALASGGGAPSRPLHSGVLTALYKSGLYHVAVQYMKAVPDAAELDDVKYSCFINLGDWSLIVDPADLKPNEDHSHLRLESNVKAFQYACLKESVNMTINANSESRLNKPLKDAKIAVTKLFSKLNKESCQSVYQISGKLQMFLEQAEYLSARCEKLSILDVISNWSMNNFVPFEDFKHVEPILTQRSLMLENAASWNELCIEDIVQLQLQYAEVALSNDRRQMSERLVAVAKKLQHSDEISLVEGRLAWASGHKEIALSLVKNLINEKAPSDPVLRAKALWQYGTWMMESKTESVRDILENYMKKSLDCLGSSGHTDTRLRVYLDIAKFADAEYEQVLSYIKGPFFDNKVKCMQNLKGTAHCLKEQSQRDDLSKEEKRAMYQAEKLSTLDELEIKNTYLEQKRFLGLAMRYYLLTLSQGDLDDLVVFRVISLWLENASLDQVDGQESLEQMLAAVPSRKFLLVLPQLSPRLTLETSGFSLLLNNLIDRCGTDHPHHTLPILLALSNSHKDTVILNASAGRGGSAGGPSAGDKRRAKEEPRVISARHALDRLARSDDGLATIIKQMEKLSDAFISLAYYMNSDDKKNKRVVDHPIPKAEQLAKMKNLESILVPTVTLPVRKDCIYTDIISVVSFSETYQLVGGINAPKKLSCKCSDGKDRPILLKGGDDLRQDAVMQQVFDIVNQILKASKDTCRQKLLIRTYKMGYGPVEDMNTSAEISVCIGHCRRYYVDPRKLFTLRLKDPGLKEVVPLSRKAGVLEWCVGTEPIGYYLVNPATSAHKRYRPMDLSPEMARERFMQCAGKSNQVKYNTFMKIVKNLKPVFHHFFTEHFPAPVMWYERRLAYTKSLATTSMVGYMLGLGDRHVQNILIDKKSAEVIHIDFGIAFDQGKALPTPETVPFRLTQDLVAGLGPSGVEGSFRTYCEQTLQLLRQHQETLRTILEVLLCDPLYAWTISPAQAKRKQNIPVTPTTSHQPGAGEEEAGVASSGQAQRAILMVISKLNGRDEGAGGGVAVPGQVARLIHHAMDPANLSRLFHGWQPYL